MPPREKGLFDALLAVQQDAPHLGKDARNPHFGNRYLSLAGLLDKLLPVLHKHGLLLIQQPTHTVAEQPALLTRIVHAASGEQIEDTMLLVLGDKNDPQGQGSALTYARRYSMMAMLGLVADEDDDGERARSRPAAAETNGKPTEASLKKVRTLRRKLVDGGAFSEEQFQAGLYEAYGVHSTADLTQADVADLIPRLETREKELA